MLAASSMGAPAANPKKIPVESRLVMTRPRKSPLAHETRMKVAEVRRLADATYRIDDLSAAISSGPMARETPLHAIHVRNLPTLAEMGAIIAPPVPAFYNKPESLDDIIDHAVGRVLDLFDIDTGKVKRWR